MIEVKNASKHFIKYEKEQGLLGMMKGFFNAKKIVKKAVDNISFKIKEGEIVGYIGANGAGKSTTIKMLTGILTPTSGEIEVNGIVPQENRVKNGHNIGVVFGQRTQLWWDLPLVETFKILKEIYEVSDEEFNERMNFFNEVLDINDFIKSPVRTLSLGQRMRADIVASLIHNPKVLYLDEPTIGLDVNAKIKMREAIKLMNKKFKTTVILTTHDLEDIEELCNRIIILDDGKIVYDGSLTDIKNKYGYINTIKFECKNIDEANNINIISDLNLNEDDCKVIIDKMSLIIKFNKNKISVSNIASYVMSNIEVSDMAILETKIEEIISNIYSEGLK